MVHPKNVVQIVELYLQALLQLSQSFEYANLIVQYGLLLALWRVVHLFSKETALKELCVQIVANISLFTQLHLQIFQSGMVVMKKKRFCPMLDIIITLCLIFEINRLDRIIGRIFWCRTWFSQSSCRESSCQYGRKLPPVWSL